MLEDFYSAEALLKPVGAPCRLSCPRGISVGRFGCDSGQKAVDRRDVWTPLTGQGTAHKEGVG